MLQECGKLYRKEGKMTKDTSEKNTGSSGLNHLSNTGGPHSRVRSENIKSSLFEGKGLKAHHEIHALTIPPAVTDIEKWVYDLYKPNRFSSWEAIEAELKLPAVSMLVVPAGNRLNPPIYSGLHMFRSAVILSKCNANRYVPDSPMIFTRTRLERNVELIVLNLHTYYELD
jgi:hypothetical protein